MTNNQEGYRVYTRWLAYELRKAGFEIVKTEINKYHPQFDVWIFNDTEELHNEIVRLTAVRKNQQGG